MKKFKPDLLYALGLAASFVLGMWFGSAEKESGPPKLLPEQGTLAASATEPDTAAPATPVVQPGFLPPSEQARAYSLLSADPRAALDAAMKLPDATRLATMQNVMAVWLRTDRLAAAEWMTERRGLREFEPLSAQVSDAFFPDDTEMSAMFSFDLTDEKLRDVRVNRLVAYWKSGAHLKFDNSPWEVDGPGTGPAKTETPSAPPPTESAAVEFAVTTETEPKG